MDQITMGYLLKKANSVPPNVQDLSTSFIRSIPTPMALGALLGFLKAKNGMGARGAGYGALQGLTLPMGLAAGMGLGSIGAYPLANAIGNKVGLNDWSGKGALSIGIGGLPGGALGTAGMYKLIKSMVGKERLDEIFGEDEPEEENKKKIIKSAQVYTDDSEDEHDSDAPQYRLVKRKKKSRWPLYAGLALAGAGGAYLGRDHLGNLAQQYFPDMSNYVSNKYNQFKNYMAQTNQPNRSSGKSIFPSEKPMKNMSPSESRVPVVNPVLNPPNTQFGKWENKKTEKGATK